MRSTFSFLLSLAIFTALASANRCVRRPNGTKFPSRESCAQYSLCFNGVETTLECEQSTMYDYVLEKCMPANVAKCFATTLQHQCPANGLKYLPHPESCEDYLICVNGNVILRSCAAGLHWSAKKKECMRPALAKCEQPAVIEDLNRCPMIQEPGQIVYLPSVESCSLYFVCFHGEAIAQECAAGFHWEQALSMCIPEGRSTCQIKEPSVNFEDTCRGIVFDVLPYPNSERRYIVCIGGKGTERRCNGGQRFSAFLRACIPIMEM